jgi:hypothetical protein
MSSAVCLSVCRRSLARLLLSAFQGAGLLYFLSARSLSPLCPPSAAVADDPPPQLKQRAPFVLPRRPLDALKEPAGRRVGDVALPPLVVLQPTAHSLPSLGLSFLQHDSTSGLLASSTHLASAGACTFPLLSLPSRPHHEHLAPAPSECVEAAGRRRLHRPQRRPLYQPRQPRPRRRRNHRAHGRRSSSSRSCIPVEETSGPDRGADGEPPTGQVDAWIKAGSPSSGLSSQDIDADDWECDVIENSCTSALHLIDSPPVTIAVLTREPSLRASHPEPGRRPLLLGAKQDHRPLHLRRPLPVRARWAADRPQVL